MTNSDTKTDDSKLVTTDTVYVSPDDGTTDEAFPKPNVEYDFCVDVTNAGELPSGPFFVQFTLSGDRTRQRNWTSRKTLGWMPELLLKQSFTLERFPTSSPRII